MAAQPSLERARDRAGQPGGVHGRLRLPRRFAEQKGHSLVLKTALTVLYATVLDTVTVFYVTDLAVTVFCVPRSLDSDRARQPGGVHGRLCLPRRFAEQKGLDCLKYCFVWP